LEASTVVTEECYMFTLRYATLRYFSLYYITLGNGKRWSCPYAFL